MNRLLSGCIQCVAPQSLTHTPLTRRILQLAAALQQYARPPKMALYAGAPLSFESSLELSALATFPCACWFLPPRPLPLPRLPWWPCCCPCDCCFAIC